MKKPVLGAVGVLLVAGVVVSGASCWRSLRNGRFTDSVCGPDGTSNSMEAFLPAYDYAELRETQGDDTFRVLRSAGTKCTACETALAAATSKRGWSNGSHGRMPGHQYIVALRGETAQVVDGDVMRLGAALTPIDTALEAAVVVSFERGLGVGCEPSVRKAPGGFEVHVSTESCFGPRDEVVFVSATGETTVISSESGPSTCVGAAPVPSPKYAAVTPAK